MKVETLMGTEEQEPAKRPGEARHSVTIQLDEMHARLTCHGDPATDSCRIAWECVCESLGPSWIGVDGRPRHVTPESDPDADPCVGEFGGDCTLVEWFEGLDNPMEGALTLDVEATWDMNNGPTFHPIEREEASR